MQWNKVSDTAFIINHHEASKLLWNAMDKPCQTRHQQLTRSSAPLSSAPTFRMPLLSISKVTWMARIKASVVSRISNQQTMDWFVGENLHRKPSIFPWRSWGFPMFSGFNFPVKRRENESIETTNKQHELSWQLPPIPPLANFSLILDPKLTQKLWAKTGGSTTVVRSSEECISL